MLIFSLIILGFIALGIFWIAKKASPIVNINESDIAPVPTVDEEALKNSQLDALAQAQAAKVKTDAVIAAANESIAKADAVLAESTVEAKPKKKKRYYKPKAKK